MLLSSGPGIVYSFYRFWSIKKANVFGIIIITNLILQTFIKVSAGSALQILWNEVIYTFAFAGFFLATMIFRRPITLFFALDFAELQGYDRQFSKKLFFQKKLFAIFQFTTLLLAFRETVLAFLKIWLIHKYGVDAFDKALILRNTFSWAVIGVIILAFIQVGKMINNSPTLIQNAKKEMIN